MPGSDWSGPTARASRRCYESWPGSSRPTRTRPVRRRDMTTAYLPQLVAADARTPRQIVTELRAGAGPDRNRPRRGAIELADPEVHADMDRMARVLRRQERLLAEFEQLDGHAFDGRVRVTSSRRSGITEDELDRPDRRTLGRQAQADRAGRMPGRRPGPAAARRARDPPRRRPAKPAGEGDPRPTRAPS